MLSCLGRLGGGEGSEEEVARLPRFDGQAGGLRTGQGEVARLVGESGMGRCTDMERLDFLEGLIPQGMDASGSLIRVPEGAA